MNKLNHATLKQANTTEAKYLNIHKVHEYLLTFAFVLLFVGNNLFDKKVLALFLLAQLGLAIGYRSIEFIKNSWQFSGLIALVGWCSYSATWSQYPNATFDGVFLLLEVMLTAMLSGYLAINVNWQRVLRNTIVIVLTINLLYIFMFSGSAISPQGIRSFYGSKNGFGLVIAFSICILFSFNNKKILDYLFIIIAGVLLVLSQSKTSLSISLIIFAVLIVKNLFFGRNNISFVDDAYLILVTILWSIFGFLVLIFFLYQKEVFDYIFQNVTDDMFTGRGKLWLEMLRLTEYKLARGMGFNSVWGLGDLNLINITPLAIDAPIWVADLAASDGGYVDIIVSIGTIGLSIFCFSLLQIFNNILHAKSINMLLAIFLFVLFHNTTETTFLMGLNINWFMLLFCAGVAAAEKLKSVNLKHE